MFFRFSEKEGELPHINGSIEADGNAVGLMHRESFFKDLIIKCLENKK